MGKGSSLQPTLSSGGKAASGKIHLLRLLLNCR
jgi:hypothetical protein